MNFSFELEKKWSRRWGVKCHDNRQALSNNVGDFIGPDPDPLFMRIRIRIRTWKKQADPGGSGSGSGSGSETLNCLQSYGTVGIKIVLLIWITGSLELNQTQIKRCQILETFLLKTQRNKSSNERVLRTSYVKTRKSL